jgi:hypothetical protein
MVSSCIVGVACVKLQLCSPVPLSLLLLLLLLLL